MRNPLFKGVNQKEVKVLDKRSSKNKNINININILINANYSDKKSVKTKEIVVLSITGIICYKLFTMSGSDFKSVLNTLLDYLSSMGMFH